MRVYLVQRVSHGTECGADVGAGVGGGYFSGILSYGKRTCAETVTLKKPLFLGTRRFPAIRVYSVEVHSDACPPPIEIRRVALSRASGEFRSVSGRNSRTRVEPPASEEL